MITVIGLFQIIFYLFILARLVKPLGWYMAEVYEGKSSWLNRIGGPERFLYRLCGINTKQEMNWKSYLLAMLVFNLLGLLAVYVLQ